MARQKSSHDLNRLRLEQPPGAELERLKPEDMLKSGVVEKASVKIPWPTCRLGSAHAGVVEVARGEAVSEPDRPGLNQLTCSTSAFTPAHCDQPLDEALSIRSVHDRFMAGEARRG
jgi:hypothetical protein